MNWSGIINQYRNFLPVSSATPNITLQEGNTPLLYLSHLSEDLGIHLYGKIEGANPTGSFKDRGMVLAVAKALESGSRAVICASTGNTSASAAAYAARAGIQALIIIPKGKVAPGKLAQAKIHGSSIVEIDGNFDDALRIVRKIAKDVPVTLVNSLNPYRLEGQKTAAFEVCDQLGMAPDVLAIPVGNAGNISAYWQGFQDYANASGTGLPQMHGFEAKGAAAITDNHVIKNPHTLATAIRIGNPVNSELASCAKQESGGDITAVSDEEIISAHQYLARQEGVFAEPASCASIAGVMKRVKKGQLKSGSTVVSVLTGNGLKDTDTALDQLSDESIKLPNDEKVVMDYIVGKVQQ